MRAPSEISVAGVYLPPLLVAAFLGVVLAAVTASLLNRTGLARHFFYPPLAFVAMAVIYTVLIGRLFIPS